MVSGIQGTANVEWVVQKEPEEPAAPEEPVEPEEPLEPADSVQPHETENPQTGDSGLPRTGGALDQLILIITGCDCLVAGVMLVTPKHHRSVRSNK